MRKGGSRAEVNKLRCNVAMVSVYVVLVVVGRRRDDDILSFQFLFYLKLLAIFKEEY